MQSTEIMSAMVVAKFNVRNVKITSHLADAFMNVYNVNLVKQQYSLQSHSLRVNTP